MAGISRKFGRANPFATHGEYNVVPQSIVDGFLDKKIEMRQEIQDELGIDEATAIHITQILADNIDIFGTVDDEGCLTYSDEMREYFRFRADAFWTEARLDAQPVANPHIQLTAGSPGAGKTTFLEDNRQPNSIYVDPDEQALMKLGIYDGIIDLVRNLPEENQQLSDMIGDYGHTNFARMVSYTYGRWGSNYISNTMMNNAAKGNYNIDFGTTASGGGVPFLFKKDAPEEGVVGFIPRGYRVTINVIDAPMDVKEASNIQRHREGSGKFVPKKDITGKAEALKDNFDLYPEITALSNGHINYWWRPELDCELEFLGCLVGNSWEMYVDEHDAADLFQSYGSSMEDVRKISEAAYITRIEGERPEPLS